MRLKNLWFTAFCFFTSAMQAYGASYSFYLPSPDVPVDAVGEEISSSVHKFAEGDTIEFKYPDPSQNKIFKLGKDLGEGVMGRVFLVADRQPPVVVKFAKGGQVEKYFMAQEIEAMAKLVEQNIASPKVHEAQTGVFIVKDFVQGKTLSEMVTGWDTLSQSDRNHVLDGLVEILDQLKQSKVVFLDISAENIMFDEVHKQWVVIDPGIARPSGIQTLENIYTYLWQHRQALFYAIKAREGGLAATPCRVLSWTYGIQ